MSDVSPTLERLRAAAGSPLEFDVEDPKTTGGWASDPDAYRAPEMARRLSEFQKQALTGERKGLVADADEDSELAWFHLTIELPAGRDAMTREDLFNAITTQAMAEAYTLYYELAGIPELAADEDLAEHPTSDYHLTDPDERH